MGRGGDQVIIQLLYIFAMIPLIAGQAKKPLFQDRVLLIPKPDRETDPLPLVRKTADPFLPPAPGLARGHIMRCIGPCLPIGAVVLPDRTPRAVRKIGPPVFPVSVAKPFFFC